MFLPRVEVNFEAPVYPSNKQDRKGRTREPSTKRSLNRQIVRKEEKGIVHLKILKLDNSIMKIHKSIRTKRAVDLFASGRILSFGGDRIARILSRSFSRQRGNDH